MSRPLGFSFAFSPYPLLFLKAPTLWVSVVGGHDVTYSPLIQTADSLGRGI
jgi:hypothetical protein